MAQKIFIMETLIDYYKGKWDKGFQSLVEKLSDKYPCVESFNIDQKNTVGYIDVKLSSGSEKKVSVRIEYDNTDGCSKNYKYGIYMGIKSDQVISDIRISLIWEKYQEIILRSCGFQMGNVFLHGDTNSSKDDSYWAFWLHLEDKYDLVDAFEPMSLIVDSLIAQGFTLCHK